MTSRSTLTALSSAQLGALDALLPRHKDFPREGIVFVDVLPLFASPPLRTAVFDALAAAVRALPVRVDAVAGLEARGFLFLALAERLGVPFVCLRKAGKLPGATARVDYALEYGTASLELAGGALAPGARVLLVDDVLATGGTARAGEALLARAGARAVAVAVVAEVAACGGAATLGAPHVLAVLRV